VAGLGRNDDARASASDDVAELLQYKCRAVEVNDDLKGVFTVNWNQPAPDGSGKPLIANEVVHALIQHFNAYDLSNASVPPDILGRAYEYLIKKFADDAGAKAGEFFTPPEVVETLVRILEPQPGDLVYDPTSGSGGMLVHCADYLREQGQPATSARYFAQEMNWGNAAIGKINSVLHGLDAKIMAGTSTITDPAFKEPDGKISKFSLVLANFPFSDEFWWLKPEQQTDDKKKKDKLKKEVFGKEGYKDPFGRFGRGTAFKAPPAGYGDYAFILHILASLTENGRAGIVCPQGVLFRGQPEVEEETGEFDDEGNPKIKRRKADDEHLIRKALLESKVIDAVISLPLNVFYGAGIPACLLILRKQRPPDRHDKVLLVYAARHFRELSAQNELRPQDVMRILVHVHAYGDAAKVPGLVAKYSTLIRAEIAKREQEEVERLKAEYADSVTSLEKVDASIIEAKKKIVEAKGKTEKGKAGIALDKLQAQRDKIASKLAERDEKFAEVRRRAQDDRSDVEHVGKELVALYTDENEMLKHARAVAIDEITDNDFNLNIPRYVDTFEPPPILPVQDAFRELRQREAALKTAETTLYSLLRKVGYVV
jgi:type I restriction enzyme M protein